MKIFALALLAFSLASTSFAADEHHEITGKDLSGLPPGSGPSSMGGVGGPRPQVSKPQRFGEGEDGGGKKPTELGGWKVGDIVEGLGTVVKLLARTPDGSGRVKIEIKKPDGTLISIEVEVKVNFGKK